MDNSAPTDQERQDKRKPGEQDEIRVFKTWDWSNIYLSLDDRYLALQKAITRLEELNFGELSKHLASADIFVEKAQAMLSKRAKIFIIFGGLCSVLTIAAILLSVYFLIDKFVHPNLTEPFGYNFTLHLIRSTTVAALLLALIYYLATTSKILFNEAMKLYAKRHSLRFGRIKFKDLEEAFKWNMESNTFGFPDMDTVHMTKTPTSKLFEQPQEIFAHFIRGLNRRFGRPSKR